MHFAKHWLINCELELTDYRQSRGEHFRSDLKTPMLRDCPTDSIRPLPLGHPLDISQFDHGQRMHFIDGLEVRGTA
jgi:hypothetical protein